MKLVSNFWKKIWFKGPFMMEKIPHVIGKQILSLKCGLGIGYGISQKYWLIWVSVSVLDLKQNTDGRALISTLHEIDFWAFDCSSYLAARHRNLFDKVERMPFGFVIKLI